MGNIRSVFQNEDPFGEKLYEQLSESAQEKLRLSEREHGLGSQQIKLEIENMIKDIKKNPDDKIEQVISEIIQKVQSQKSLRQEMSKATIENASCTRLPEADLIIRFPHDYTEDITYFPQVLNGNFARLKHLFLYQALANTIKLKLTKFGDIYEEAYRKRNDIFYSDEAESIKLILSIFKFDEKNQFHVQNISINLKMIEELVIIENLSDVYAIEELIKQNMKYWNDVCSYDEETYNMELQRPEFWKIDDESYDSVDYQDAVKQIESIFETNIFNQNDPKNLSGKKDLKKEKSLSGEYKSNETSANQSMQLPRALNYQNLPYPDMDIFKNPLKMNSHVDYKPELQSIFNSKEHTPSSIRQIPQSENKSTTSYIRGSSPLTNKDQNCVINPNFKKKELTPSTPTTNEFAFIQKKKVILRIIDDNKAEEFNTKNWLCSDIEVDAIIKPKEASPDGSKLKGILKNKKQFTYEELKLNIKGDNFFTKHDDSRIIPEKNDDSKLGKCVIGSLENLKGIDSPVNSPLKQSDSQKEQIAGKIFKDEKKISKKSSSSTNPKKSLSSSETQQRKSSSSSIKSKHENNPTEISSSNHEDWKVQTDEHEQESSEKFEDSENNQKYETSSENFSKSDSNKPVHKSSEEIINIEPRKKSDSIQIVQYDSIPEPSKHTKQSTSKESYYKESKIVINKESTESQDSYIQYSNISPKSSDDLSKNTSKKVGTYESMLSANHKNSFLDVEYMTPKKDLSSVGSSVMDPNYKLLNSENSPLMNNILEFDEESRKRIQKVSQNFKRKMDIENLVSEKDDSNPNGIKLKMLMNDFTKEIYYFGAVFNGMPNGHGVIFLDDGSRIEGYFVDGNIEGQATHYRKDSTKIVSGLYRKNELNGYGKEYYESGLVKYKGGFRSNFYHNKGIFFDETGFKVYEGFFNKNYFNGQGILYNKNGSFYSGFFIDGKKEGKGKLVRSDSITQEGIWKNDNFIEGKTKGNLRESADKKKSGSILRKDLKSAESQEQLESISSYIVTEYYEDMKIKQKKSEASLHDQNIFNNDFLKISDLKQLKTGDENIEEVSKEAQRDLNSNDKQTDSGKKEKRQNSNKKKKEKKSADKNRVKDKNENVDEEIEYSIKLYDGDELNTISEKANSEECFSPDFCSFNPKKVTAEINNKYPGSQRENRSSANNTPRNKKVNNSIEIFKSPREEKSGEKDLLENTPSSKNNFTVDKEKKTEKGIAPIKKSIDRSTPSKKAIDKSKTEKSKEERPKSSKHTPDRKILGKQILPDRVLFKNSINKNSNFKWYEGDISNEMANGEGTHYYKDGRYYKGNFKDNLWDGKGAFYRKNAKLISKGIYKNGFLEKGKIYNTLGFVEKKGDFDCSNENKFNGFGTLYDKNCKVVYEGYWRCGIRNGKGCEYSNTAKYDGCWVNNLKSGYGELNYNNGDWYKGNFKNNMYCGEGSFFYLEKNEIYKGEWLENKKNGNGLQAVIGTSERYKGEFFNDMKEGNGTYYYPNGDIYSGEWNKDYCAGFGTMYYQDNNYYRGNWFYNRKDGQGEYVWSNGCKYLGEWYNNLMKGSGEFVNKSLKFRISGKFVFPKPNNGYITGDMYNLSSGRQIYKGEITCILNENGFPQVKKEGKGIEYFANGDYYEGNFSDDKKDGRGMLYNAQNVPVYSGDWQKDTKNGQGVYKLYTNGQLYSSYKGTFKDNIYNGYGVETYSNGDQYDGLYFQGKKHGKGIMRIKDQKNVVISGNWNQGLMEGSIQYIDPNNGQIVKSVYKDNEKSIRKHTPKRSPHTSLKDEIHNSSIINHSFTSDIYSGIVTKKRNGITKLDTEIDRRNDDLHRRAMDAQSKRIKTTNSVRMANTSRNSKSPKISRSINKTTTLDTKKTVERRGVFMRKEDQTDFSNVRKKEKSVNKINKMILEEYPLSMPIKKKSRGVATTIKKDTVSKRKSTRSGV